MPGMRGGQNTKKAVHCMKGKFWRKFCLRPMILVLYAIALCLLSIGIYLPSLIPLLEGLLLLFFFAVRPNSPFLRFLKRLGPVRRAEFWSALQYDKTARIWHSGEYCMVLLLTSVKFFAPKDIRLIHWHGVDDGESPISWYLEIHTPQRRIISISEYRVNEAFVQAIKRMNPQLCVEESPAKTQGGQQ